MKLLLIIVLIIMIALTSLGYFPVGRLLFAGESAAYMIDLIEVNLFISTAIVMLFGFLVYSYFKKTKKIKLIFLSFCVLIWILSGRTVAIIIYPEGRVSCGWFYMETDRFYLCNATTDCETTISYHTKIEPLSFWRIRIKNEVIDKKIFVNPFAWSKTLKMFNDKFLSPSRS